ncbi:hypothetical protein PABG_04123 [Paracoccidioides brasiliensis Pb03]|uniref:RGS domain-containing protein n=2 Tax=Paracoccidioides brasiliensis TaxID=121759 RepID=C1GBU9_PARBD|nr:uncharacterized protein PADG_04471 [Paracoccidioides brasiliensis Pb18]EEH21912.1 hypothetical protein PABG_04123 [Paracoccidioides brasiliensis Pb03]EEH48392.2 hypothetical protein PADG_04471 [Paracoccidioides brasiliensis Pb18]ODH46633.1 hypothetical protein GX48_07287 [Paracoccidioides brasiliensis]
MEGWQPSSRPLSLAIPNFAPRPTLDDVLSNTSSPPYTLSAFMAFLSQNHCLETLEFTMEANRYRDSYYADPTKTQHLCMLFQRILKAYIVPAAPREINVSSEVRDDLLSHSNSPTPPPPETLHPAVNRMRDLMEESIFIPFLNSQSPPSLPDSHYDEMTAQDDSQMGLHASMRRQLSPQPSCLSPRSPATGLALQQLKITGGIGRSGSRSSGYALSPLSGDSGSANLTDDSGSMTSSLGAGEPMTPPTTPPSSDVPLHFGPSGHNPKFRPADNAWKKMGLKLGWKKRAGGPGSKDGRFPATEEE